ncbi:hypothetical protein BJ875DRAFT_537638 [Amylocarpus encephaloides]|uniref:Fungal-type protein kinase domain-containing protein n=1 Tax=Amylocarpus encephaloides TaxID=45428 RepID=A0A9P8C170_9HELO|nr:hypothetical protein BJ875DRAFT_537638 [Amylocarpus encephaloides]
MANKTRSEIIKANPIGKGLDAFRASFNPICEDRSLSCFLDVLARSRSLSVLETLPAARLLLSRTGRGPLRSDLLRLELSADSDDFDIGRIKPLLNAVDSQTPWLRNSSSFANSSEYRKHVDVVLKEELGSMYISVPGFHERVFGGVPDLETISESVFKRCMEGDNPLFCEGWNGWSKDANQEDVLSLIAQLSDQLVNLAEDHRSTPKHRRRPLAQPSKPIHGSTAENKLDICFVNDPMAGKNFTYHWSQILVPGELKSNPSAGTASKAWLDHGRYAREVLAAQETRRFVLGFTLCGSFMRVWELNRLGGIASERFDINQDGLRFGSTILGFLWMNEEELEFDPTIISEEGRRYIEIERNGQMERLIINRVMKRARCIAGRATTCWKAYREGDPRTPLVIKDSWQYPDKGVVNVARYYHHETVFGLDITKATNYKREISMLPSYTDASLPARKRSCSTSPTKARSNTLPNRVHRRVIVRDYGKPIYKASSRVALLETDDDNPSWRSFLIDLDLAIKEREGTTGARGNAGTRAFIAIGVLHDDEKHSFMHDLESFFWVLFWICVHYNGPNEERVVPQFDKWNSVDTKELAKLKLGTVSDEGIFNKTTTEHFTEYRKPLMHWLNRLRRVVFSEGRRWKSEDRELYSRMKEVIREARKDPKVLAGN